MASGKHEILGGGGRYPEEDKRTNTLVRSLSVLDEWLEQNEGLTDDEARVRRMKRWREEAMEQLELLLEPGRT
jgi:hypothetical protein